MALLFAADVARDVPRPRCSTTVGTASPRSTTPSSSTGGPRGWALVAGDPADDLDRLGELLATGA